MQLGPSLQLSLPCQAKLGSQGTARSGMTAATILHAYMAFSGMFLRRRQVMRVLHQMKPALLRRSKIYSMVPIKLDRARSSRR